MPKEKWGVSLVFLKMDNIEIKRKSAEPGGSLDAVKRCGADARSSLAAQVTLIVVCLKK
jgi:hypothetical protein